MSEGRAMRDVPVHRLLVSASHHAPVSFASHRLTSVDGSTSALELENLVSELDLFELNLPVTLAPERNVINLALEVLLVNSTERGLGVVRFGVGAEVESKLRLVEETLVDEVVEGRDDVGDRDGVVGQSEDTIKLAEREGESGLDGRLGKVLVLDGEVTNGENIVGDDSFEGSRTVLDLELGAVGLVSGRGGGIVLGVKEAGDRGAAGRRDPKVGGSAAGKATMFRGLCCRCACKVGGGKRTHVSRMTLND